MKTQLKRLAIAICLFGAVLQVYSQGYIVPNGVVYVGFVGSGYQIAVVQNPTNSDYTGFALEPQNVNTFLFSPVADEGVRTFLVQSNQTLSLQPILDGSFMELTYPNLYAFANHSTFYLGFYTGYAPVNGVYSDPLFGWGQFVNNQGVITMVGSAIELGGGGIIAGTQTILPIPEPSTAALFVIGLASLVALRRCRA